MRFPLPFTCRAAAIALLALNAAGCPQTAAPPQPPSATVPAWIPPPRLSVRAQPIFRLVVPPNRTDLPTRLVVLFVRVDNIHHLPVTIGPERIRLELPDGSRRHALDAPRAVAILQRTVLAVPEIDGLDRGGDMPDGGLRLPEHRYWHGRVLAELFPARDLGPGESAEGFVVVDTGRRFWSLRDSAIEAFADSPRQADAVPARALLGPAIDVNAR